LLKTLVFGHIISAVAFLLVMRLIALVFVALAVSASALVYERDLSHDTRKKKDPQTSWTLDSRVFSRNFEKNGTINGTSGQVPSLTSNNNFINFCLTVDLPLTNGQQIKTGSCNPAPMGVIPPTTNMPSSKFVKPKNLDAIQANTTFEIIMAVQHLATGFFTNPDSTYYAAPQQLDSANDIIGHTHFVIEKLSSIISTEPSDPSAFVYFTAVNIAADVQGNVYVNVNDGLPPGTYKLSSINTSANHAPVLVPVAQHGSLDDQVYFYVTSDGNPPANLTSNVTE